MSPFRYGKDARIVHFLGPSKPWHSGPGAEGQGGGARGVEGQGGGARGAEGQGGGAREEFVGLWWREYLQQGAPLQHTTQVVKLS